MPQVLVGNGKKIAELASIPGSRVPFTRACAVWPFVDFLDALGAPTERFLQQAGIPSTLLEDPESLVPLHLAYTFAECAANEEGIENLGLIVAQQVSAYDIGAYGKMLREALTVYDFLQMGVQMIGSVTSGHRFWLSNEGDRVRFHQRMPGSQSPGRSHADVYTLAVVIRMLRGFTDDQWSPEEVCLLNGSESMSGNSDTFRDAKIKAGQAHSSFTIPKALLQQPIPLRDKEAQPGHAHLGNMQPSMPDGLENSVEEFIALLLPDGCPDIHLTAEAAGMSTRTLQRRLSDSGTSYSRLLKQTRMRLAANSLADTVIPVNELATSLGYTNPANFTRAFRRKTGISPQQYRAQLNNAQ